MSYKVQFLDDDLFDQLPGYDMEHKVGVAYPKSGLAFARRSGIPVMDAMTAAHELEHLSGNDLAERYDEEHGCYYKGFGDVLQTVAPIALGLFGGPLFGALGEGLSGIGGGIASGLGAISPALGGAAQSFGGALGSAGQGIGSMFGIGGQGASNASGLPNEAMDTLQGNLENSFTNKGIESGMFAGSPNVIPTGAGALGDMFGKTAQSVGGNIAQNSLGSMFGGQQQFQMPDFMGSQQPQAFATPGSDPQSFAGGSGTSPQGGFGGGPGLGGGGQVSKLKGQLAAQGNSTGGEQK